ncbi:16S rRNA (guanine(966)-N(2))-methyltransferase RsmD [Paramaledivibacter caminithermalis]|uniref:16S rRNA (guanine(966)-N(2))-methyltransferase RsmD n=1 Tax=Paramaledivibacter caminithermalis TaxID=191027 RepID=UPI0009355447|nr:16S rRNA (guanine(966)-N(2))-methyltransferase RsmD [Paramaledivibacter caminithermalis]
MKGAYKLRVISGEAKGIRLSTLKGTDTRPTSDKVKESIFNILAPYIEKSKVLDLFSGTGNLGIEAVSRGAESAFLVEKNRKCYDIIKKNIMKTKLNDKIKIIIKDVYSTLKNFSKIGEKFDIIFMDPPYLKGHILTCLKEIKELDLLNEDGIIVAEHDIKDIIPETIDDLIKFKERKYGGTMISFYHKED